MLMNLATFYRLLTMRLSQFANAKINVINVYCLASWHSENAAVLIKFDTSRPPEFDT